MPEIILTDMVKQEQLFKFTPKDYFVFPTFKKGNKQTLSTYIIDQYEKSNVTGAYSIDDNGQKDFIVLGQHFTIQHNLTLQFDRQGKYPNYYYNMDVFTNTNKLDEKEVYISMAFIFIVTAL